MVSYKVPRKNINCITDHLVIETQLLAAWHLRVLHMHGDYGSHSVSDC